MLLDLGNDLKQHATLRALPPTPNNDWRPPAYFPNLDRARVIAFDTETFDPYLLTHGPGWGRGQGEIVGVSVAAIDHAGNEGKWYFPVRHRVDGHLNLPTRAVFGWLADVLGPRLAHVPKVGANLLYDIGWLTTENVFVEGTLHDVQYAEAILDEDAITALDALGRKYCNAGKESDEMYQWLSRAYGGKPDGKQRANIFRAPPALVGTYAEQDAALPIQVLQQQYPLLSQQGLLQVYRMECDLIYLLVRMRLAGVSIDLDKAEQLYDQFGKEIPRLYAQLSAKYGVKIESVSAPKQLAPLFDKVGVRYNKTANGQPSFTKDWMKNLDHPIGVEINEIREIEKIRRTFIQGYLLDAHVNGKVYGSFHPLRQSSGDDRSGARTGRFSSSHPNLQNIPARTELGKQVRTAFVPDPGHVIWRSYDYSQIEYRLLAHFAVGAGSDDVRQRYNDDPNTDYHVLTQLLVKEKSGIVLERKPIKNINFGLLYGMGVAKLARSLGLSMDEARPILEAYHQGNPYVRATMEWAANEAQELGYTTTILGRRNRFDLWEPAEINYDSRATALSYEMALRAYGSNIIRASTHKAVNNKLQGSAGDMMKVAMWRCWKDGIYDYIGVPRLTVHDELNHSDPGRRDDGFREMQRIMETCLPELRVPIIADLDTGDSWGGC